MDWKSPFVVYRINQEGKLEQVFVAEDFQAASYWLTYIAEPGDVLCKTPAHKKHSHNSPLPEYWSHKGPERIPVTNEERWRKMATKRNFSGQFPDHQAE
ncbi:MAG: hypothetical protein ACK5GN_04800 [Pseudomonadota bacterium]|jgi:hypothetical protein